MFHLSSDPSLEPLSSLLYRYWFWGWLFRDVTQGTLLIRHAAWAHNLTQRHHLPVYMRRWLGCVGSTALIARVVEIAAGATITAATLYAVAVLASCVLTVTVAGWALLGCAQR
jgi:hypothetical protein